MVNELGECFMVTVVTMMVNKLGECYDHCDYDDEWTWWMLYDHCDYGGKWTWRMLWSLWLWWWINLVNATITVTMIVNELGECFMVTVVTMIVNELGECYDHYGYAGEWTWWCYYDHCDRELTWRMISSMWLWSWMNLMNDMITRVGVNYIGTCTYLYLSTFFRVPACTLYLSFKNVLVLVLVPRYITRYLVLKDKYIASTSRFVQKKI